MEVTVEPLDDLDARNVKALADQVDRIGEIVQAVPRLTVGPVSVGPHA